MKPKQPENPQKDFAEMLTNFLSTSDFIFLHSPKWGNFSIQKLYDKVLIIIPNLLAVKDESYSIEILVSNERVTRIISRSKNNKGAFSIREDEAPAILRQKIRNLPPVAHLQELFNNFSQPKDPPDEVESLETSALPPKEPTSTIMETIQKIRSFFRKMI